METKTSHLSVKKAGEGKATVVIATMRVKDKDGDVLLPGAFGEQVVPVVGAHEWKMPPIGKAHIREVGDEALADIEFNDTTEGQNWYRALKFDWDHPPARQQYSWGFQVPPTHTHRGKHGPDEVRFLHGSATGEPLPIFEVSPVLVGAGQGTRSLSVKAFDDLPPSEEQPGSFEDLKQAGVRVQSLIFPKDKWESAEAVRAWLRSHDFSTELDTTGSSWRARQEEPGRFQRLRSFCINPSRDASAEACRVMAVGGPMKETRGVDREAPEASPERTVKTTPLPDVQITDPDAWQGYPEDRRPPLTALIKWLRLYRYHLPFLRDIRKRDGKEIASETIAEFKLLVEEMLEVTAQFNIKLRTAALLPSVEEDIARQEHYKARHRELSSDVNAKMEEAFQALQAQAQALEERTKRRQALIRQWGKDASAQAS